jgi:uncharacterized protein (DUF433 family)
MAIDFGPSFTETEDALLMRIVPRNGRPMLRHHRLGVEEVLGLLAAGDTAESILRIHAGLDRDDIRACLAFARRVVGYMGMTPGVS